MRRIFNDWLENHSETKRLGSFTKTEAETGIEKLEFLETAIRIQEAQPNAPQTVSLPKRPAPLFPPSTYDLEGKPKALILSKTDQADSDAALQALLHWSCWTRNTLLISYTHYFFRSFLGADFRTPYTLPSNVTYEDWRLRKKIVESLFQRFPNPSFEEMREISGLTKDLAYWSFNEVWWGSQYRQDARNQLIEDLADWLLSSKEDFGYIAYLLFGGFQSYRFPETAPATQKRVLAV